jgi:hypothetical protein
MNCDSIRRDHMAEQYLQARNKRPREGAFSFSGGGVSLERPMLS